MVKKKKKPRFAWVKIWVKSKAVLITVASVIGFFGGFWTLDQRWLPREIHDIAIAQVHQTIKEVQKETALQSARSEVFYWLRRENELKTLCTKNPKDDQTKKDLEEAVFERRRAEDEVKRLQTEKR